MRLPGGADDDVPALDHHRSIPDLEGRLPGLDDEHLGIRMPMHLRPDARLRVDEDHAERDVAVLGADEFVRVLGRLKLLERRDRSHGYTQNVS